jgi:hypothetical protein
MVITGAADRATDRVGHLVYLDAATPADGQSLVDMAGPYMAAARADAASLTAWNSASTPSDETIQFYGVIDPEQIAWMKARLTPHPWRCFEQPIRLTNEDALGRIPQTHISTTFFLDSRDVDHLRQVSNGRVWDLDTGHDMMLTEPEWVAEKLLSVASLTTPV